MPARLIDGKQIAAARRQVIQSQVADFTNSTDIVPHLAAILVGDDPASAVYVRNKQKACETAGIKSTLHRLAAETTTDQLQSLIDECNADPTVHGILVQLPLPPQIDEQQILDAVRAEKDVDGFHPTNVGLIAQGRPRFLPCTPAGVQILLEESGTKLRGAEAVVLGRSEIVGKPMAMLLMQRGADATVTVCHSRTRDVAAHTKSADVLIAAMGRPKAVTADMVKPGAVVIDVGTNRVDGKLVGDVDFEAVQEVASAITPVPGGVGPMTITMLLANTLTAARLQITDRKS